MSLLDDDQLVDEVKKYPFLFDTNVKGYKDHQIIDETWVKIATKLQVKPLEAKNRWRSLRGRFVREKKLISSESKMYEPQRSRPWPMLEDISSIWNFAIDRRRHTTNSIINEPKTHVPIAPKRNDTEWVSLNCENNSEGILRDKDDQDKSKQKTQKEQSIEEATDQVSDNTHSYTQRTDHCVNSQSYAADGHHYFCMSVAETLRRFTQRQSVEAKLRIQQILYEIEISDTATAFENAFVNLH